jgi:hypothetical protein
MLQKKCLTGIATTSFFWAQFCAKQRSKPCHLCHREGLKCSAYLFARAHTHTIKTNKTTTLQPAKNYILKREHLVPGHCVSVYHYISSVMGWLPCTFDCEQVRYSCGTPFVDYASGKLFNYCLYSTNVAETISSKHRLESLSQKEGFSMKEYHAGTMVSLLLRHSRRILIHLIKNIF